ncbi:MAG: hypothetical protein HOF75_01435 [Flavobacteriaceae bacterium]|jgi:hypothetical protein|nr:hypothetical protein [Flavobacteriaceae bacterium]MBT3919036.1 hypothetical protein [Flavobacteriaceae bacterium]MBT6705040.1 hypothetical protein [Flavobacteriaceae bacterium]MBT7242789.1 hypothetical protein [Flavobacteriaceae bacterium]|tara:strand:+ start:50 stop:196 length:147 start_codon:yes stop_codon:yes gene_type:complete
MRSNTKIRITSPISLQFLQTHATIKFIAKINPELNPDLALKIDFIDEN